MQRATKAEPLALWCPGNPNQLLPWWKEYYDKTKIQPRDRCLFAKVPLPPDVATTKTVDWKAVDVEAAVSTKKPAKRASAKRATAKQAAAKKVTTKKVASKKAPIKKATAKTTKKVSAKAAAKKQRRHP